MAKLMPARQLRFDRLDDVLNDARRIAEQGGPPTRGAWTASENIWHVARYLQASVEGYPFSAPWWMKLIGPMLKKRMISKPMSSGFKAPANVSKHMEPQSVSAQQTTMENAMRLLEDTIAKAKAQGYLPANPVFGKMSAREWEQLHCRHAELHFGLIELAD